MKFKDYLIKVNACTEAVNWVQDRTIEEAWSECDRGDWMLWLAGRLQVDSRVLTLAKVKCARLVEHLMTDQRSIDALEVAERYAEGKANERELAHAAYAAADAAHAAYAAADAAAYAAHAADVYASGERKRVLSKCADIVRENIDIQLIKEK